MVSNKTRILHIISSLNMGGTERQCVELAKRIDKDKFEVTLLTFNKEGPLYSEVVDAGIPVNEIKIPGSFYRPKSLFQILRIALFMRKERFQIVQTYGMYSNIPGILAAKLARVPVIIGGKRELNEIWPKRKVAAEMMLLKKCNKVVANAQKVRDYLMSDQKVPGEKIEVIYNGIDLQKYVDLPPKSYSSKSDFIGMIANFRPSKDQTTFIKAAAEILKQKPNVRFALVGSGRFEEGMKSYAKDLRIQDSVIFYGEKFGQELLDIFRSFTITVLSSHTEGFPNVIMESMALGIPVIATPSGGVPELIDDGVTGYLFPFKRHDVLAEKMLYLLNNRQKGEEVGKNARVNIKNRFNFELMAKHFESLYEQLCNGLKH